MQAKEFIQKYYVKREHTNCVKWDNPNAKGKLPLWVADADFKIPEEIIDKMAERIKNGIKKNLILLIKKNGFVFLKEQLMD